VPDGASLARKASVRRVRRPRHVDLAGGVHGHATPLFCAAPTEVGAIDELGAVGRQLRHEGVGGATPEGPLQRVHCREVE